MMLRTRKDQTNRDAELRWALAAGALTLGALMLWRAAPRRAAQMRKAGGAIRQTADALRSRAAAMGLRTQDALSSSGDQTGVGDQTLERKIARKLRRVCTFPTAIAVRCRDGLAYLIGDALDQEIDAIVTAAALVPGVREVRNQLNLHESATATAFTAPQLRASGHDWTRTSRLLLAVIAGAGLLAVGAYTARARRSGALPRDRPSRCLELTKTIEIYAPVEEVYAYWQNLENFPEVMRHVMEVRKLDEDRYYWRVAGVAGKDVEWESEVTARVQDELLAWRSAPGSQVRSSGVVQFEPTAYGGTRLHVRLSYSPPAGTAGHALARLLGRNPLRQMNEDLARFKTFIEIGKPIPGEGPATRH